MRLPNKYKAKGIDDDRLYEGYYFQFPKTTYCFTEDYERNPPKIIHGLIFHQMTDWGLPNKLEWAIIDPDTLEEIVENVNVQVHEHPCGVSGICMNCGGDVYNDDPYCSHCGERLKWM